MPERPIKIDAILADKQLHAIMECQKLKCEHQGKL